MQSLILTATSPWPPISSPCQPLCRLARTLIKTQGTCSYRRHSNLITLLKLLLPSHNRQSQNQGKGWHINPARGYTGSRDSMNWVFLQTDHAHSAYGGDSTSATAAQSPAAEEAAYSSAFLDAAALGQEAFRPSSRGEGQATMDAIGKHKCLADQAKVSRNKLMEQLESQKWLSITTRMITACFGYGVLPAFAWPTKPCVHRTNCKECFVCKFEGGMACCIPLKAHQFYTFKAFSCQALAKFITLIDARMAALQHWKLTQLMIFTSFSVPLLPFSM